jgi:hypothetical protein
MLLELAAFSRESLYQQATILLGTDCNDEWYLAHFETVNIMCVSQYTFGRKCLDDFESLLTSIESRKKDLELELEEQHAKRAKLDPGQEDKLDATVEDQNLDGFSQAGMAPFLEMGEGSSQAEIDKALETEAELHRLANALFKSPLSDGVRPTVPEWALARNKVPSYYMMNENIKQQTLPAKNTTSCSVDGSSCPLYSTL